MNLYTYCGNNPINWIDPFGLCYETTYTQRQSWFDRPRPRDNFWGPAWDIGNSVRELYHLGAAAAWAIDTGVSEAIGYGAEKVGYLTLVDWPAGTIMTPWGRPLYIDLNFIGHSANIVDTVAGDYAREYAKSTSWMAKYHLYKSGFGPSNFQHKRSKGPDGIWRSGDVSYKLEVGSDGRTYIVREVTYCENSK